MAQTVFMGTVRRMGWVGATPAAGALWGAEGPAACTGSGYGALSFWVGDWIVSAPGGRVSGAEFRGSSLHALSAEDKRWHQLNVDNHGHVHAFEARPARMV